MALIQVGYVVPLGCMVDTETGEITRVTLYDEEITPDGTFHDERGLPISSDQRTARAVEIAESRPWPARRTL
jgi:hypothetical protein